VLFVTFENSRQNLVLKGIAARAGVNSQQVERGTADLQKLARGAVSYGRNVARRLALVEGNSRLSLPELRSHVQGVVHPDEGKCLVIVDFLQLWAKAALTYRGLDTVRGRVEALGAELRELATELKCPIIAIASQNREQGAYGQGTGKANLDSLKESGDLEYLTDVAMFLIGSKGRSATPPARAVELCVRKNRYGDTGQVNLIFRPDLSTFREEAPDE
jgi:replicative DNA helicase